ncbi:PilZ domain-containing protein [Dongia soli]|uniref:PilZ domain-containing protein n=1 Tax=Dongia soli TaxID=600628 RepID=A0ABU5EAG2_9PROT|nr:PilZ domain-containing protein [Dongia soli]MDY0883178.1 PilZ domain-containing protein [Dongia soli]
MQADVTLHQESRPQDRRLAPRRRALKGGKILINGGQSVFDCTVQDISASGARLSLGLFQPLPRRFELTINGIGTQLCEWVRSTGSEFGVRFLTNQDIAA